MLSAALMTAGCSKSNAEKEAYAAACAGPPLRTIEAREKAMQDGYNVIGRYDCIDKASFLAIQEQKARWEAANTPEAKAQRAAEREKRIAEDQARTAAAPESQPSSFHQPSAGAAPLVRCTSADGKSSTLQRGKCAPGETPTLVTPTRPLMERSDANKGLIKCTSRDGKKASIQRGNCANPDDYQQQLGDH